MWTNPRATAVVSRRGWWQVVWQQKKANVISFNGRQISSGGSATVHRAQSGSSSTTSEDNRNPVIPFYGLPRPPPPNPQRSNVVHNAMELLSRAAAVSVQEIYKDVETKWNNRSNESSSSTDNFTANNTNTTATIRDRLWTTWHYARMAANDPTRADAVAAVGELTGRVALAHVRHAMHDHDVGRQILSDRPLVSKATIPYDELVAQARYIQTKLSQCGSSNDAEKMAILNDLTFGQAYGLFLLEHGFDPDERDPILFLNDTEHDDTVGDLAYVMVRYRQCHDFWHVLTGLPPTIVGELGLKWLELFDTGLPSTALACTVGSVWATCVPQNKRATTGTVVGSTPLSLFSLPLFPTAQQRHDVHVIWNVYLPWARRISRRWQDAASTAGGDGNVTAYLMNVYYEKEWDTPLVELRARLHLEAAPKT
jgi:ubiquinone biosynthesis protein COQ4